MPERLLYDTQKAAAERRRLLDLIPPPGPGFLAAAEAALRRSGIRPLEERRAEDGETGEAKPSGPDAP
jgi:hypothetical protein